MTTPFVTTAGNSLARYQNGFYQEYPLLQHSQIFFVGQDGFTSSQIDAMMPFMVPPQTTHCVLYDLTNDVIGNVPENAVMFNLQSTINKLLGRNPNIKIIIPNEHPWLQVNCCGDRRDYIDQLNGLLPELVNPNVTIVDVWTPNILQDGSRWADPNFINGFCGVHPDVALQWTIRWAHFTKPITDAVKGLINAGK